MADAEVFVNQAGFGNATMNSGVTNAAGLGGNAFGGASGNIGVNIASGNNNEQKNALAASVATTAVAQSSISSNQVSTGNTVSNAGFVQSYTDTVQVGMRGGVSGLTLAYGAGTYRGTGNAYQMANYYLDTWSGELPHPGGSSTGHIDLDDEIQNATMNPNRPGVGGLGFDTRESGTSQFVELGVADLYASLSGTVSTTRWVNVNATNTSALSGSAFSGASGNIGVNVAAGTGNLQANSLAWQSPSPAPAAVVAAASKRNTPAVRQWPGSPELLFLLPLGQELPLLPENAMFGHRLSIRLLACCCWAARRAGGRRRLRRRTAQWRTAAAEGGEHAGTALPQRGTPAHRLQLRSGRTGDRPAPCLPPGHRRGDGHRRDDGVSDPALVAERGSRCSTSSATWSRWAAGAAIASMRPACARFGFRVLC